jgi:hypothetical protein
MPAKTDLHKRAVLNVLRGQDLKAPVAGVYFGLMAELPDKLHPAGREVKALGYERQLLILAEPDEDSCTNATEVIFPVARVEDWPPAPGVAIFFAAVGGMPRYAGEMDPPVTVRIREQLKFEVGAIKVREL